MSTVDERVAAVEVRVDQAFALDARLKALEADVRKLKGSGLRDWLQTLGPYVSGVIVLLVGFWIKDSVNLALARESLDLEYVKQMRDLVKDFDESATPTSADANAVGLAMYGPHAVLPLVERLAGGDVASVAAEHGLRLVGSNSPAQACPKFMGIVSDTSRRFRWLTQDTVVKVIGQSTCTEAIPLLENTRAELQALGTDRAKLEAFRKRYPPDDGFDFESVTTMAGDIDTALEILAAQPKPSRWSRWFR